MSPEIAKSLPLLEDLHRKARAAYVARDLKSYMDLFSPDLLYHQIDGHTIGRDELTRDVESQFRGTSAVDSAYRTDAVETDSQGVIESLTQWAWIATSVFGFLHRLWRLERRGRYRWRQTEDGWKIVEVTVLEERVIGSGLQFGRVPRLPDLADIKPMNVA